MLKFASFVFATLLSVTAAFAQTPEIEQIHRQMLLPSVQVDALKGTGSGTVISSREVNGNFRTYILTNHHVIAASISIIEYFDQESKSNKKREKFENVQVRFHRYANRNRYTGSDNRLANIVAYDAQADIALLILDDNAPVTNVAIIAPKDARIDRGERVYAVGAGLGVPPFMTEGRVGSIGHRIDGHPYILASAPIIFGNSGGALFRMNSEYNYEFIGIPSRVSSTGGFFSSTAVTHIGWHIQLDTIREFLERNRLSHIID